LDARLCAVLAADRAAQPVKAAADDDAPDEEAGVEIQPHMPAVEVAAIAAATATTGVTGAPAFDEEGPVWPDEAAESAMRVEVEARGETLSSRAARESAEAAEEAASEKKNLPPLAELVGQIPENIRETIEELFRAKFVSVKRIPKTALKE
jgi:hypothetical protein